MAVKHDPTSLLQYSLDIATSNIDVAGGPFGAVIVRPNGVIVGYGGNSVTKLNDPSAHAEVMAIRNACSNINDYDLSDCILYSSCEPCPMCLGAIYWARIKEVIFAGNRVDAENAGFIDKFIYDEFDRKQEDRHMKCHKMEISNPIQPFQYWAAFINKKEY